MLKANRSLQDRTMSFLAPKTFSKDFHEMGKKKNKLEWPCSARFGSIMDTDYPSNPFWVMTSSQPVNGIHSSFEVIGIWKRMEEKGYGWRNRGADLVQHRDCLKDDTFC